MKSPVSGLEPRPVDQCDDTIYMLRREYLQHRLVRLFSFASPLPSQVLGLLPCLKQLVCVVKEGKVTQFLESECICCLGVEFGCFFVFGGSATAKETSSTFGFLVCLVGLASWYGEKEDTFASSARGSAMIACQPCTVLRNENTGLFTGKKRDK